MTRYKKTCGRKIQHWPQRAKDSPSAITKRQLFSRYITSKYFGTHVGTFENYIIEHGDKVTKSLTAEHSMGC